MFDYKFYRSVIESVRERCIDTTANNFAQSCELPEKLVEFFEYYSPDDRLLMNSIVHLVSFLCVAFLTFYKRGSAS